MFNYNVSLHELPSENQVFIIIIIFIIMKTSGWGIIHLRIWKSCYVVQTISLSTSGRLKYTVILLMGNNEMALLSIELVYRVKECTPAHSCLLMHCKA